jgi:hypothetical protein
VDEQVADLKNELETSKLKINELEQRIDNDRMTHDTDKKVFKELLDGLEKRLSIQELLSLKVGTSIVSVNLTQ